jgi:dolichol-phosphate mannosyltransferase
MKISVVLPTYNEKDNIVKLISQLRDQFLKSGWDVEAIVVDDNSADGTAALVEKSFKDNRAKGFTVRVIKRVDERGLPTAVRRGMDEATGEFIGALDTDLSHPVKTLVELANAAKADGADLYSATRWKKGGGMIAPIRSHWLSKIINSSVRQALKVDLTDFTGGFFVLNAPAYAKLTEEDRQFIFNQSGYGEYFIKFLAVAKERGLRLAEIPFVYLARTKGSSKTSVIKHGKLYVNVIRDIQQWRKRS